MKEDKKEELSEELDEVFNKYAVHIKTAEKNGKIPKNNYALSAYLATHIDQIYDKTMSYLMDYINRFSVNTENGVDELKLVYWLGNALMDVASPSDRKYIFDIMIFIMLDIVFVNGCDGKEDIIDKYIQKIKISNNINEIERNFGKYGIYTIFKVILEFCGIHNVKN